MVQKNNFMRKKELIEITFQQNTFGIVRQLK
jgi:hypothetical protein